MSVIHSFLDIALLFPGWNPYISAGGKKLATTLANVLHEASIGFRTTPVANEDPL